MRRGCAGQVVVFSVSAGCTSRDIHNSYAVHALRDSRWNPCTKRGWGWVAQVWLRKANLAPLSTDEEVERPEQEALKQEAEGTSRLLEEGGLVQTEDFDPDLFKLFQQMDVDKNGTLSLAEFVAGMSRLNLVCAFPLPHL